MTVYAAYGEYLLVWRADDGEIVTQIQMPTFEDMQRTTRKLTSVPYYWNPRPEIVSLLYHEGRLLVIVQGYGHLWSEAYAQNSSSSSGSTSYPILYDYQATYGRVYSTSSLVVGANDNKKPTLDLVADFNINGLFKGVRAIDGHVHIVTTSGVDTYTELVGPFERWNYPTNVSTEQYIEQATEHADVRIKGFVDSLVEQLKGTTGRLPDNLARLNLWDRISSGTSIERLTYHNGLVNTIAMVHSLDMTADKTGIQPSVFKSSAAFVPSYDVEGKSYLLCVALYLASSSLLLSFFVTQSTAPRNEWFSLLTLGLTMTPMGSQVNPQYCSVWISMKRQQVFIQLARLLDIF